MSSLQAWYLHRFLVDRLGVLRPFSSNSALRVLLVTENNPISHSQVFPFLFYKRQLQSRFDVEIRELPLTRLLADSTAFNEAIDFVFFQTWFDLASDEMDRFASTIQNRWPGAKLTYLDWFAPTDLRYAEALNSRVAAYVKKQVLSDFAQYDQPLIGHTNLTNYYCKRFNIDETPSKFVVPETFRQKLVLGSSFELSPQIMQLTPKTWSVKDRPIDLHSRITANGTTWYSHMRREALDAAERLDGKFRVKYKGTVSKRQFFAELFQSKMCFSPFGYGEVCWRDFEAMACGALLLKPDMSHIEMQTNPFRPYETYIPIAWDLSDLDSKVEYYLRNENERLGITQRAFETLKQHHSSDRFLSENSSLWSKLGLTPAANKVAGRADG
ncbi:MULTISPECIES: glycosyltransferase [unclassified Bradyrhizobium]